jgi:hypothetical protein
MNRPSGDHLPPTEGSVSFSSTAAKIVRRPDPSAFMMSVRGRPSFPVKTTISRLASYDQLG